MKSRIYDRASDKWVTARMTDRHDLADHPAYLQLSCEGRIVSGWLTAEHAGEAFHAINNKDLDALGALIDGAKLRSVAP